MKVDGGEWELGTSLGTDWYSGGSYHLPSVLSQWLPGGTDESQTTLLRITSLWHKTRTWDSPNTKEDTTHLNVTLQYLQ